MLGAAGATLGTRLYASAEALADPRARQLLLECDGDDTVRTSAFDVVRGPSSPDGHDGRAIVNRTTEGWERAPRSEGRLEELRAHYRSSAVDDYEIRPVWAGEGLDQIDSILPAARIIDDIVDGAVRSLDAFR